MTVKELKQQLENLPDDGLLEVYPQYGLRLLPTPPVETTETKE